MSLKVWLPFTYTDVGKAGYEVHPNLVNPKSYCSTDAGDAYLTSGGKLGTCMNFGPALSALYLYPDIMTNFTECSVCFWLKINNWNKNYCTFFQAGREGRHSWNDYTFGILRNSNSSNIVFTVSNLSSGINGSFVKGPFNLNQWYHICCTYNKTTSKLTFYIDGQQSGADYTSSVVPNFAGITQITIGKSNISTDQYQTDCNMNDFRIYDHCLSPEEVYQISKGLFMHFKLDNHGFGHSPRVYYTSVGHGLPDSSMFELQKSNTKASGPSWDSSDILYDNSGMGYWGQAVNCVCDEDNNNFGHYADGISFIDNHDGRIAIFSPYDVTVSKTRLYRPTGPINMTYPLSMSCWIKFNDVSQNTTQYVLSYSLDGQGFAGQAIGVCLYNKKLTICYGGTYAQYNGTLSKDTWYHVVVVVTNTTYKMYLNGELIISGTGTITNPGANWLTLGARSNSTFGSLDDAAYYFKGLLKDFRFYATELLADDVKLLYNNSISIDNFKNLSTYELVENDNVREVLASGFFTSPFSNKTARYTGFNDNGEIVLVDNQSIGSNYIPITPTNHTYFWEAIISVEANNQFYLGFERYDVNKTSTSNNSCIYAISVKPTTDIVKKYYSGTINLAKTVTNVDTDTICLRILNDWSGHSNRQGIVHYISLREVSTTNQPSLTTKGQIIADYFREYPQVTYDGENNSSKTSFYANGVVESAIFIEK